MSIRPDPSSRSSPILVRSARHECEAAQLGGLHAEDLKTPRTTPSHQIQILAHVFAYVHTNGPGRSAVATGCHPGGPGRSAEDPKPIPYSESLPDQLRRVQPMCTTSGLPNLPANHDPSRHRR